MCFVKVAKLWDGIFLRKSLTTGRRESSGTQGGPLNSRRRNIRVRMRRTPCATSGSTRSAHRRLSPGGAGSSFPEDVVSVKGVCGAAGPGWVGRKRVLQGSARRH